MKILKKNKDMHKSDEVKALSKAEYGQESSNYQICKVFRNELGLKYKMSKKITFQGNSERNLVLRQQFAIEMLKLLDSKKRILNVDESSIVSLTFPRKKWKQHGTTNSIPHKQVQPSNSLIAAIDTEGDVYISITQVYTDASVMKVYLIELAK